MLSRWGVPLPDPIPDDAAFVPKRRDSRRVEDENGQVRCRSCLIFKPPAEMKWHNTKRGPYCGTICRPCHNRLRSSRRRSDAAQEHRRRMRIAWGRALGRLGNQHIEEFRALVAEELGAIGSDQVVDVRLVSQHIRRVYGQADEAESAS